MKKKNSLEKRMYGFVPYNISEIQKGIQFGHAVVEYSLKYSSKEEYLNWAKKWKTFIILNGGTTNNEFGKINEIVEELKCHKIDIAIFREPDLNDALTSVVFLVDERVFNYEKYPDFISFLKEKYPELKNRALEIEYKINKEEIIKEFGQGYKSWIKTIIGSETNAWLRDFLKNFRLA